jgi:hypothetical protein
MDNGKMKIDHMLSGSPTSSNVSWCETVKHDRRIYGTMNGPSYVI